MKRYLTYANILIILSIFGCQNSSEKNTKSEFKDTLIDYYNIEVLDSIIKSTPNSSDTIFLGFIIGNTKSEYDAQIRKLKKDGLKLTYSESNEFTNFAGSFDLGSGWTYKTDIFSENATGETLVGKGEYFLEPVFNNEGYLTQLNILPIEKWDNGISMNNPNWLKSKIKENSSEVLESNFLQALRENQIIDENHFVRKKGRLIIYETLLTVNYVDKKLLLEELVFKIKERKSTIEGDKKVQF